VIICINLSILLFDLYGVMAIFIGRVSTKGRRRFTQKVLSGLVLLFVLIGSLVFAFPIYFKSVTVPTVGKSSSTCFSLFIHSFLNLYSTPF